jgi:alkanesulfonate monooxygenase SsuD/methylene tetrahydromethanopterin reductase-like flavin-dependent oxidoreductase (luciferase family)
MTRIGVYLDPPVGTSTDEILARAQSADAQGFESFWLPDHLIAHRGDDHAAEGPFDMFTMMVAIGATTQQIRLAWGMLNPTFRNPGVLAKMLSTLDHISHGRVVCAIGAGWLKPEYEAYNLPFLDDHAERLAQEREVIQVLKQLWTNPAPARVSYDGTYVTVTDLPFNPAPVQKPHPPIWVGGDSDATLALAREEGDGWVPITRGERDVLPTLRESGEVPEDLDVIRIETIIVAETREQALEEARPMYEATAAGPYNVSADFDDYVSRHVIGTPEECRDRLLEVERTGVTHHVGIFATPEQQDRAGRLLLPLLDAVGDPA